MRAAWWSPLIRDLGCCGLPWTGHFAESCLSNRSLRCGEVGLGGRALQWVWLALWQPGPGLGLQGVAGRGESQPW